MADYIRMTPSELEEAAKTIRIEQGNIDDAVKRINSLVTTIEGNWDGAAQQAFIAQYNDQIRSLLETTVPEVLEGVATELETAATTLRDTDEQLASAMRGN